MVQDRASTCRLARDGDGKGVATKLADEELDPRESKGLVEDSGIDNTLVSDFLRGEEAKSTKLQTGQQSSRGWGHVRQTTYSVLDRDNNKALVVGVDDLGHVLLAIAIAIAASVDPDQDGEVPGIGRGIDVEKEAVLVAREEGNIGNGRQCLRTDGAKGVGVVDGEARLGLGEPGRLPPQVTRGCGSVPDAVVLVSAHVKRLCLRGGLPPFPVVQTRGRVSVSLVPGISQVDNQ